MRWLIPTLPARSRAIVLVSLAGGLTLLGLALLGTPLSHDEASFAVGGRTLVTGAGGYWPYRPVGMQPIAAVGYLLGGGDLAMRAFPIAIAVGFLATVWQVVRRSFDDATAVWTAAATACSFVVLRRGFGLESDLPAAVLGLGCIGLLAGALESTHRRWSLVWLAPLGAGAFYLRFGSAPILAAIALSAAIVWRDRLRTHAAPLALAAVGFGVLLVPHALHSIQRGGDALWIVRTASEAAGRAYVGDGAVYYATTFWAAIGPVALVMLAGVAAMIARRVPMTRKTKFFALTSLIGIIALGLTAHGEARYALIQQVLLTAIGVHAIRGWLADRRWGFRAAIATLAIAWLGTTAVVVLVLRPHHKAYGPRVVAAAWIRKRGDAACYLEAVRSSQLAWYSGCRAFQHWDAMPAERYVIVFDRALNDPSEAGWKAERGNQVELLGRLGGDGAKGTTAIYRQTGDAATTHTELRE